jgi:ribonuclease BN (tRNA processing enzyme)
MPRRSFTLLTVGEGQTVKDLRGIFETQMQSVFFPVQLEHMGATFRFVQVQKTTEQFKSFNEVATMITAQKLNHPGGSYGFRIERNGKVLVICTDLEHGDQIDPLVVKLAQGADLLVHDAQYTAEELPLRKGWGHSSYDQAMQVAEMSGAKRLALTHHDPEHDDEFLLRLERLCQERFKECLVAREGMELEL